MISTLLQIFGGCCSNVLTLETITLNIKNSVHLITFCQFLLVSILGFPGIFDFSRKWFKKPVIPIYHWLGIVSLFWSSSLLNNMALDYSISMPFHIIFRSAGLITTMVLSWIFLKTSFTFFQVAGVIILSLGVGIVTLASSSQRELEMSDYNSWLKGMGCLFVALFLSSVMGLYQQVLYSKFGKVWREGLFYMHFLSLPAFLLFKDYILNDFKRYSNSELIKVFNIGIPYLWALLVLNVLTQYVCISGVQQASSTASAVTLNLILSLRKFTSLVLSVILFKNHFTGTHWVGSILVFLGTICYSWPTKKQIQDN